MKNHNDINGQIPLSIKYMLVAAKRSPQIIVYDAFRASTRFLKKMWGPKQNTSRESSLINTI